MGKYQRLFSQPSFLGLYFGQVIARLGDGIGSIVIIWNVWALTNSPVLLALTYISQTVAILLFSFLGGLTADRIIHRKLMIFSDILRVGITVTAAGLSFLGWLSPVALIVTAFLTYSAGCFFSSARAAMVPKIVPKEDLHAANGLLVGSFHGALLIGPAIGGLLIDVIDIGYLILINALTYLISIFSLLLLPDTISTTSNKRQSHFTEAKAGLRAVIKTPALAWVVGTFWIGTLLSGGVSDVGRTMLSDQLGSGAEGLGFMSTAVGVGLMIGSLLIGNMKIKFKVRFIVIAWITEGILLIFLGNSHTLGFALFISFLTGMSTGAINVPTESLIQLNGGENTGKIYSYWTMTIWVGQLISLVTIVPLFSLFSMEIVFTFTGALLAVLAIIGFCFSRNVADTSSNKNKLNLSEETAL